MEPKETKQMLQVGMKLQKGKYVIKKQLASGGFGNTYVVVDKQFEDEFALKEFFIKGVNDRGDDNTTVSISNGANTKQFESQKEKFKKEARRLRKLNNKHIVRVYDLFDENDTAYYVMDYIDGESLSSRLKKTGTPLSEKEAMSVFRQILDALEEVHNLKIWHLDLKPGNILVNKDGDVVLIDFGASKQLSTGEGYETTTSSMCYTKGYAPSEQVDQNMDRIGAWTDLYALGATLYNLITCTPPPQVSEIQEGNAFSYPDYITKKTRELIEWMMNPNRNKRPQSVAEVRQFLASASSSDAVDDDDTIYGGKKKEEKKDEKQDDDDDTIYGGKNNKKKEEKKKEKHDDNDDIDIEEQYSEIVQEEYNNQVKIWTWIIIVFIAAITIYVGVRNNGVNSYQYDAIDSDSIAVVDSVDAYEYADTVAVDSIADYY